MSGYAKLLNSEFVAAESERFRTFESVRLVLTEGDESVLTTPRPETLNPQTLHYISP